MQYDNDPKHKHKHEQLFTQTEDILATDLNPVQKLQLDLRQTIQTLESQKYKRTKTFLFR